MGVQKIFSIFLSCLLLAISTANAQVIKNLQNDWLVFDESSKQLFPFVEGNKSDLPLHIQLDTKKYPEQFLSIVSSEPISIYVNHKFYREIIPNEKEEISIDSISLNQNYPVLLSFYGIFNKKLIDSLSIVGSNKSIEPESIVAGLRFPLIKASADIRNYFAFLLIFSFAFLALIRTSYAKFFDQYVSLAGLFGDSGVDKSQSRISFDGYNFAFILLSVYFFALACVSFPMFDAKAAENSFFEFSGDLFHLMLLAIFFYVLKYMVTYSASWLFSINKFATSHFLIFVRVSVLWSIVLLLLTMLQYSDIEWLKPVLIPIFLFSSLFFLTLTSIKVSFLINRVAKVSTLYLISYLCITEWLPYFIILKLYMVYFY